MMGKVLGKSGLLGGASFEGFGACFFRPIWTLFGHNLDLWSR
jgi:hypothetical protein